MCTNAFSFLYLLSPFIFPGPYSPHVGCTWRHTIMHILYFDEPVLSDNVWLHDLLIVHPFHIYLLFILKLNKILCRKKNVGILYIFIYFLYLVTTCFYVLIGDEDGDELILSRKELPADQSVSLSWIFSIWFLSLVVIPLFSLIVGALCTCCVLGIINVFDK